MSNNWIAKPDYHGQIMLGEKFFFKIFETIYDSGVMPEELILHGDITLKLRKPESLKFTFRDGEDPNAKSDMELTFRYKIMSLPWAAAKVGLDVEIDLDKMGIKFKCFDEMTERMINDFGAMSNQSNLLEQVKNKIKSYFDRNVSTNFRTIHAIDILVKKLEKTNDFDTAIGVGLIFDTYTVAALRPSPFSLQSFLPYGSAYALAIPRKTLEIFGNHIRNLLKLSEVKIIPVSKGLDIKIKADTSVPGLGGESDLEAIVKIQNDRLYCDMKLKRLKVKTGLFVNVVAFALFVGPMGNYAVYKEKTKYERRYIYYLNKFLDEKILPYLRNIPGRLSLFETRPDPFFNRSFDILFKPSKLDISSKGIYLVGDEVVELVDKPIYVEIVDKVNVNKENPDSPLMELEYAVPSYGKIKLSMEEVNQRLSKNQLAKAVLTPTYIRKKDSAIREIKFSSGVDFTVNHLLRLSLSKVLRIHGHHIIISPRARMHFRAVGDGYKGNNLGELPRF